MKISKKEVKVKYDGRYIIDYYFTAETKDEEIFLEDIYYSDLVSGKTLQWCGKETSLYFHVNIGKLNEYCRRCEHKFRSIEDYYCNNCIHRKSLHDFFKENEIVEKSKTMSDAKTNYSNLKLKGDKNE